jgi:hypothetical protein
VRQAHRRRTLRRKLGTPEVAAQCTEIVIVYRRARRRRRRLDVRNRIARATLEESVQPRAACCYRHLERGDEREDKPDSAASLGIHVRRVRELTCK